MQGSYPLRSLSAAAAEEEGKRLAAEATPPHPDVGLIGAFPGSAPRSGQQGGAVEARGLSAAKTPLSYTNPLAAQM